MSNSFRNESWVRGRVLRIPRTWGTYPRVKGNVKPSRENLGGYVDTRVRPRARSTNTSSAFDFLPKPSLALQNNVWRPHTVVTGGMPSKESKERVDGCVVGGFQVSVCGRGPSQLPGNFVIKELTTTNLNAQMRQA